MSEKIYEFDNFVIIDKDLSYTGKTYQYQIVKRKSYVTIVPQMQRDFIMIKEFRPAIDNTILQFPSGRIEDYETPEEAAKRELCEETGFTCSGIRKLGCFYSAAHFTDELIYVYFAYDLVSGEQRPTERELISVECHNVYDIEVLIRNNKILDAKTIIAFDMWRRIKDEKY